MVLRVQKKPAIFLYREGLLYFDMGQIGTLYFFGWLRPPVFSKPRVGLRRTDNSELELKTRIRALQEDGEEPVRLGFRPNTC